MKHFAVSISNELSDMISDFSFDPDYQHSLNTTRLLVLDWIKQSLRLFKCASFEAVKSQLDIYRIGLLCEHDVNLHFAIGDRNYVIMREDGVSLSLSLYETSQSANVIELPEEDMPF